MAERLHILMPCARWQNIGRVSEYMLHETRGNRYFEVRWHILQQGPEPDPKGYRKINEALGWINTGWVWAPSDDSIHHPELFHRLWETVDEDKSACRIGAVVFSEEREGGLILHATPSEMRPGQVDGSQVFFRREFLGDDCYRFETDAVYADGMLIERRFNKAPHAFKFVDEVLIQFNALERALAPENTY